MIRSLAVAIVLVALLAAPPAAAAPILVVAYTPDGIVLDDAERFYLKLTVSEPEAPHSAEGTSGRCAQSSGQWLPWFPTCFSAGLVDANEPLVFASYDARTGRYHVALGAEVPTKAVAYGGTTGAGLEADCVPCPEPP